MSKDAKLQALRTTCELEEQQALEHRKTVDSVVEQRQRIVDGLSRQRDDMERKLDRLRTSARAAALHQGDARQLAAINRYDARLSRDLGKVRDELSERTKELAKAQERAKQAEQALVAARVERRKIEKYVESWQHAERLHSVAVEEVTTDEMNVFRRDK